MTTSWRSVRAGQPPVAEPPSISEGERRSKAWEVPVPGHGLGATADAMDDGGGPVPNVGLVSAPFAFEIDLTSEQELGPDGGVKQTLWGALAHNHSEGGYRRALALREAYRADLLRKADEVRREEEARQASALLAMGRLLDVDMDDPRAVEESLSSDWGNVRVDTVADDADDVRSTKLVVLRNFAMINDLYRHFCGNSRRGDTSSMQLQEFEHLVVLSGAVDVTRERKLVPAVFKQVNAGRGAGDGALDEKSMSRFEFIEALLLVARHRLKDRRSGHSPPCSECLTDMLNDCMRPVHERLGSGEVRSALRSRLLRRWLLGKHESLKRVFDFYCRQGSRNGLFAEASVLMDEEEFTICLDHAGFLPPAGTDRGAAAGTPSAARNPMTRTAAREAFAGVQRDDEAVYHTSAAASSGAGQAAPGGVAHSEQLAFNEFIEAIARVSLSRWPDKDVQIEKRVAWGLSVTCELEDHLGEPRGVPLTLPASRASSVGSGGARGAGAGAGRADEPLLGVSAGLAGDDASSVDAMTSSLVPRAGGRASAARSMPGRRSVPIVSPMAPV